MIEEKWCRCRITEPKIVQRQDTLLCVFCGVTKELPPKVDLAWERLKKSLIEAGRDYYKGCSRETLIDMLAARDKRLLDDWRAIARKGNITIRWQQVRERAETEIPYIVFNDKERKGG